MEELKEVLQLTFSEQPESVIISSPRGDGAAIKIRLRPIALKNLALDQQICYQAEEFTKTQVFHKNLSLDDAMSYVYDMLNTRFHSCVIETPVHTANVLISKKGHVTVKLKKKTTAAAEAAKITFSHNREKNYIIKEGTAVPFLVDLGVMTSDGRIVHAKYDKFRQINRFLEYIDDVIPYLPTDRELRILDFGCGKSYLTFAVYYYLKVLKGYSVRITGLDLKEDVIARCNELSKKYGYDKLEFLCGDIAFYDGCDAVDMVVTLHACDTATDYALAKAVGWGAKVILSVPCCQHELNKQIKNELMEPLLKYGIVRERMAALITDSLRAEILESKGYRTQLLEFIDMAHTPKNLLIRAVHSGRPASSIASIEKILTAYSIKPTLYKLLCK